ncbi:MAG: nuclear transport factor 2 family protein [Ligilactobacillus animalis]|uniref:nuclear transport factor 2 family protein n=1 Tax=Ligilactobacillus animalis TaxID=1605 RepID=UPI00242F127C|nr:nuclear transport factor 2 family protein [Ligilactobacillus animalis]MCI5941707.1 nuclear transport factor 2 family protein [Ligilactobacillus animalis]MDY2993015.1 nuclear transport factor 2 family protein [Ligilactobacillus animalis]
MNEELLQKEAIREVIDRFSNLEIDVKAQAELFTADASINVFANGEQTMAIKSRKEMVEQFSAFTAAVKKAYHMNGQQVITFEDEQTATDVHYCQAVLVTVNEDGQEMITNNYIRYTDTLVKEAGKWLIKQREQEFVITETRVLN